MTISNKVIGVEDSVGVKIISDIVMWVNFVGEGSTETCHLTSVLGEDRLLSIRFKRFCPK